MRRIGVDIVDVRLKRVDFVPEISADVYRRMESERKRVANELRATGQAEGEKIKADADRQRQVIVADAYRDAQRVKGDGDAQAARIYAEAFGKNPEFYSFYRSMEAYRQSLRSKSDVMVLDPSSDFFKYLKSPGARQGLGTMIDYGIFAAAFALMLVIEGILPFVSPVRWRGHLPQADRDERRPDPPRGAHVDDRRAGTPAAGALTKDPHPGLLPGEKENRSLPRGGGLGRG